MGWIQAPYTDVADVQLVLHVGLLTEQGLSLTLLPAFGSLSLTWDCLLWPQ